MVEPKTKKISNADTSITLANLFPTDTVTVTGEQHRFEVFQTDGEAEAKLEYQLNKAPIQRILRVVGEYNGSTIEFTKGEDYELSQDNENIVWQTDSRSPNPGTSFSVDYVSESILKRYIESAEGELEIAQDKVVAGINNKFIESASGDDLDRIGAIFGDTIGLRRGRSDEVYRAYLNSVVRSFVSRGTKTGIRLAISAATDVPIEEIEINEFFEESGYEVSISPNTPITGSTLEEIAEVADPSGIEQLRTRFLIDEDIAALNDDFAVNNNKFDIQQDATQIDDGLDDTTKRDKYDFKWEPQQTENNTEWGYSEWVKLNEEDVILSNDRVFSDDTAIVRENPTSETVDNAGSTDSVENITVSDAPIWDNRTWDNLEWQPGLETGFKDSGKWSKNTWDSLSWQQQ